MVLSSLMSMGTISALTTKEQWEAFKPEQRTEVALDVITDLIGDLITASNAPSIREGAALDIDKITKPAFEKLASMPVLGDTFLDYIQADENGKKAGDLFSHQKLSEKSPIYNLLPMWNFSVDGEVEYDKPSKTLTIPVIKSGKNYIVCISGLHKGHLPTIADFAKPDVKEAHKDTHFKGNDFAGIKIFVVKGKGQLEEKLLGQLTKAVDSEAKSMPMAKLADYDRGLTHKLIVLAREIDEHAKLITADAPA